MGVKRLLNLPAMLILGHLLALKEFGLVAIAAVTVTIIMAATEIAMIRALFQASVRGLARCDVAWTAGGATLTMFLSLVWVTDEPLRIGVRECLAEFFPILGSPRAGNST